MNNNKKLGISWFLALCIMGMAASYLWRFNGDEIGLPVPMINADARLKGICYKSFERGGKGLEFKASEADLFQKKGILRAQHIELLIIRHGRPYVTLRSVLGDLDINTHDALFQKDVRVYTRGNGNLFTDELAYKNRQDIVETHMPVTIVRDDIKIMGKSLWYSLKKEKMIIKESRTSFLETGGGTKE